MGNVNLNCHTLIIHRVATWFPPPFFPPAMWIWFRSLTVFCFQQFIFSTDTDGKIKVWLYDDMSRRVDFDALGQSCTTMAYSADGTR